MRRAALALVVVLAACSGGGDHLTERQFIRQGDAICRDLARGGEDIDLTPSGADGKGFDAAISDLRRARAAFAALDPPQDGQAVRRSMLAFLDASIGAAGRARQAVADGDSAAARTALARAVPKGLAAYRAAESYGFQECAGPSLPR